MSYGKIGLTTVAVTHDLLSGVPLVLLKKNSSAFGTVYYLNQDNPHEFGQLSFEFGQPHS